MAQSVVPALMPEIDGVVHLPVSLNFSLAIGEAEITGADDYDLWVSCALTQMNIILLTADDWLMTASCAPTDGISMRGVIEVSTGDSLRVGLSTASVAQLSHHE